MNSPRETCQSEQQRRLLHTVVHHHHHHDYQLSLTDQCDGVVLQTEVSDHCNKLVELGRTGGLST